MRPVAAMLTALWLVAACSSGETSETEPGDDTASTNPDRTTIEPSTGATEPPATTPQTTVPDPASELADALRLSPIELLTPPTGGGDRPDLAWAPVDGADTYQITVLAPDGTFYWGWAGAETTVPMGGFPRLVPEAAGPRLIPAMTWTVTAYDATVAPIALGGPAPIGP